MFRRQLSQLSACCVLSDIPRRRLLFNEGHFFEFSRRFYIQKESETAQTLGAEKMERRAPYLRSLSVTHAKPFGQTGRGTNSAKPDATQFETARALYGKSLILILIAVEIAADDLEHSAAFTVFASYFAALFLCGAFHFRTLRRDLWYVIRPPD